MITPLVELMRSLCGAIFKPRPRAQVWEWIDEHVSIPDIVGSTNPGRVRTERVFFWRHVWFLYWHRKTRFVTIQASARIGKTFFALCCVLHKVANWPGPIGWLDPTRFTARRFTRTELQPFVMQCEETKNLAMIDRTHWTLSEMFFSGSKLNMLGSGSVSETTGFQAELVVINESNKCQHDMHAEAGIHDIMIGRSKQFRRTRKVIEVSTPTDAHGRITTRFREGSQHYVYFPCPSCRKFHRITFSPEEKEVPWNDDTVFDERFFPTGERVTSIEKTISVNFKHCKRADGSYDLEKVERETNYKCNSCEAIIPQTKLNWMLRHCTLRAHNPDAPEDHISFQAWAGFSPFEHVGAVAKKFLLARGNIGKMHSVWNDDFGLPFVRHATQITESDIDVAVKRSPQYLLKTLPRRPTLLTMTIDVQGQCFWWSVRAWGIIPEHPDVPIWSALVEYGSAVSWDQIEEIAGIKAQTDGTWNEYEWPQTGEKFRVVAGLVDSGFEAQQNKNVYGFCIRNGNVFSPSKGGGWQQLRGMTIRTAPVADDQLELVWYEDATAKQQLYYHCLREHKSHWWLPLNIGPDYRRQMTAEHTEEKKQQDGTVRLEWVVSGADGNHLGDTEKMHEVLRPVIEGRLAEERELLLGERAKEQAAE